MDKVCPVYHFTDDSYIFTDKTNQFGSRKPSAALNFLYSLDTIVVTA